MTEDQPLPPRTCGNCACLDTIQKPKLQPPGMSARDWDSIPDQQYACRLNPPLVAQTATGRTLIQMPTDPSRVCWHWKPAGTLPGDNPPPVVKIEHYSGGGGGPDL